MCGFVGFLEHPSSVHDASQIKKTLHKMTELLSHRGPDDVGFYENAPLFLGHRRLSIFDLSSKAHQPMLSANGRFALVYNGALYNFRDLKKIWKRDWRSDSDTEVLCELLAENGMQSLKWLNGMFAFALWDSQERELFLVRDRYGIKPLYYLQTESHFLFSSEIKSLLAWPSYSVSVDKEALIEYFTFQNIFSDRTLFQNIRLLPAGCFLRLSLGAAPHIERYWDYAFQEPITPRSETESLEELSYLFSQAVQRQLISDVEVGSYLSGGMDSSSITALASQHQPYLKTFTCGFDLSSASGLELSFDERAKAEALSNHYKTDHFQTILKSGDMERVLPRLTWHLEDLRVGQSYPNFYAAELASRFVKVVLSGTGGDEMFGGYPWRYYRAVVNDDFEHYVDKYYLFWQRLIPNRDLKKIFSPISKTFSRVWTRDIFRNVFQEHADQLTRPEDYIHHSLYFEAKTFLHGLLLVEDKLSMAHGLETRVPFLDNDLVDFAMRLPARFKLGNLTDVLRLNENEPGHKTSRYFEKTKDGKLLLRKAMENLVPREVTQRVKQGFSAPDASWFKGESIHFVKTRLFDPKARLYDFMDAYEVQKLVSDHLEGRVNRRLFIWSLLNFEEWCGRFLS
jgi:asparagine synthase (glutamine-hydrolysing)